MSMPAAAGSADGARRICVDGVVRLCLAVCVQQCTGRANGPGRGTGISRRARAARGPAGESGPLFVVVSRPEPCRPAVNVDLRMRRAAVPGRIACLAGRAAGRHRNCVTPCKKSGQSLHANWFSPCCFSCRSSGESPSSANCAGEKSTASCNSRTGC